MQAYDLEQRYGNINAIPWPELKKLNNNSPEMNAICDNGKIFENLGKGLMTAFPTFGVPVPAVVSTVMRVMNAFSVAGGLK